ncbi:unnamed protein product [Merluccius merluccius]
MANSTVIDGIRSSGEKEKLLFVLCNPPPLIPHHNSINCEDGVLLVPLGPMQDPVSVKETPGEPHYLRR